MSPGTPCSGWPGAGRETADPVLPPDAAAVLAIAVGVFATVLGLAHFGFLHLFDFPGAMPKEGPALRRIRLGPFAYQVLRTDTWGIAVVMNLATSFTILGIGLGHLWLLPRLEGDARLAILLWWAAFWAIRALGQFALGRRPLDWTIAAFFAALAGADLLLAASGPAAP